MENKNKLIIIALMVVIVALLAGILISMPSLSKTEAQLEVIGNDTLVEGDNLQIKLTDANGVALANQTVKITFADKKNSTSDYSVVTNDEGVGELKLDKNAGEYDVTVTYDGNDNYNGCDATKKITIEEKVVEAQSTGSGSSLSSESSRYTTDEHGTYDNVNNRYIDRQFEGMSKAEVQEFEDRIRRNGGMI